MAVASVIVPAHNEVDSISRLLDPLVSSGADDLEIIVVCNGCTDGTADRARRYQPQVRVLETPVASKPHALRLGMDEATAYPRILVDADVVIDRASIEKLIGALSPPDVHAAGPVRRLDLTGASWPVRAYYAVWERLPAATNGLYGRGVVALDREGSIRLSNLPDVMGDDLYIHSLFTPAERHIVPSASVTIRCPRRLPDLVRRRVRTSMGNTQHAAEHRKQADSAAAQGTSLLQVARVARQEPRFIPAVAVFLGVTVCARLVARQRLRKGKTGWLRDESSRAA